MARKTLAVWSVSKRFISLPKTYFVFTILKVLFGSLWHKSDSVAKSSNFFNQSSQTVWSVWSKIIGKPSAGLLNVQSSRLLKASLPYRQLFVFGLFHDLWKQRVQLRRRLIWGERKQGLSLRLHSWTLGFSEVSWGPFTVRRSHGHSLKVSLKSEHSTQDFRNLKKRIVNKKEQDPDYKTTLLLQTNLQKVSAN